MFLTLLSRPLKTGNSAEGEGYMHVSYSSLVRLEAVSVREFISQWITLHSFRGRCHKSPFLLPLTTWSVVYPLSPYLNDRTKELQSWNWRFQNFSLQLRSYDVKCCWIQQNLNYGSFRNFLIAPQTTSAPNNLMTCSKEFHSLVTARVENSLLLFWILFYAAFDSLLLLYWKTRSDPWRRNSRRFLFWP